MSEGQYASGRRCQDREAPGLKSALASLPESKSDSAISERPKAGSQFPADVSQACSPSADRISQSDI